MGALGLRAGLIPLSASPGEHVPKKRASPAPSGGTRVAPRSGPGCRDEGAHARTRAGPALTLPELPKAERRAREGAGGVEEKEVIMNKSAGPR